MATRSTASLKTSARWDSSALDCFLLRGNLWPVAKTSSRDIRGVLGGLVAASAQIVEVVQRITDAYRLGPRGAWIIMLVSGGTVAPLELSRSMQVGRNLVRADLNRLFWAGLIASRKRSMSGHNKDLALTPQGAKVRTQLRRELVELASAALIGYRRDEVLLCSQMLKSWNAEGRPMRPPQMRRRRSAIGRRAR